MAARLALLLETALALALAWTLVFVLPTGMTVRLFGASAPEIRASGHCRDARGMTRAKAAARRVSRVAARLPWRSTCLVQAVAGALLLARRHIAGSVIRLGVRKQEGRLTAHAWLLLDGLILLGGNEAADYIPIADIQGSAPRA